MVRDAWCLVRIRSLGLLSEASARYSNFELQNPMFEKHLMDMEAVWQVVTFVEYVWFEKFLQNKYL